MTLTGAAPEASRRRRMMWIDRQPVQTGVAVTLLVVGTLVLALGVVELVVESIGASPVAALQQVVIGAALMSMAGLAVSRPGPDRRHVIIYRAAWVAITVPIAACTYDHRAGRRRRRRVARGRQRVPAQERSPRTALGRHPGRGGW